MSATETRHTLEQIGRLGDEAISRYVTPNIRPEDNGKYVAIDIESGEYELDEDDLRAIKRLRKRFPTSETWLGRIGYPTAYEIR